MKNILTTLVFLSLTVFTSAQNKKFITLWGSGKAERELIYVDDLADACIYFMDKKLKEIKEL